MKMAIHFDDDNDGVYNYLDKEKNTPQGLPVDNNSIQLSKEQYGNVNILI